MNNSIVQRRTDDDEPGAVQQQIIDEDPDLVGRANRRIGERRTWARDPV